MERRPTIIDVARRAGVSKSTVSLVIRNSEAVRPETRAEVRKAMAEIGYVYNRAAAHMRTTNSGLIGLVINDLRNPFFTEFATSLQMALAERGYAVAIANTDEDAATQDRVIGAMIEHGVSALILSSAYGDVGSGFDAMGRAAIPALQVLRCADARTDRFPFAAPDYVAGSRLATRHLIAQGARRIAFVGGLEGRNVTQERMSGYLEILREQQIEPIVLHGRPSRAFGRSALARLHEDHPDCDAALCFNDLVAFGILTAVQQRTCPIRADFRVVGFDDIEEAAEHWPPLSSVRCDINAFGSEAARTVYQWLEDGDLPAPVTRTPVELIARSSSLDGAMPGPALP